MTTEPVLTPADAGRHLRHLEARFGIPRRLFDAYRVHRPNRRKTFLVRAGLEVPAAPPVVTAGVPFAHVQGAEPRVTNAVLRAFGRHARRNVADVGWADAEAFFTRTPILLAADAAPALESPGQVIVRCEGVVLGLGRATPGAAEGWEVQSVLAKKEYRLRSS